MAATFHGADYDQLLQLVTTFSPDPAADAAALLEAGFTPELATSYLEAWRIVPQAGLSASAFIRLDQRGITPAVLTEFAKRGFASANEIIRSWTAYDPLIQEGVLPDIIACLAQGQVPVPEAHSAILYWADASLDGAPDLSWEQIERLHLAGKPLRANAFSEGSKTSATVATLAEYLFNNPQLEDWQLSGLVDWALTSHSTDQEVFTQVVKAIDVFEEDVTCWHFMCRYERSRAYEWVVPLREQLPEMSLKSLAELSLGLGYLKADTPGAELLDTVTNLLTTYPGIQQGRQRTEYHMGTYDNEIPVTTHALTELGKDLAFYADKGNLETARKLLDQICQGDTGESADMLLEGLCRGLALTLLANVRAHFPELPRKALATLAEGDVPSWEGKAVYLPSMNNENLASKYVSLTSVLGLAEVLPEAALPDIILLTVIGAEPERVTQALSMRPSLTLAELIVLLRRGPAQKQEGDLFWAWLEQFNHLNPGLDNPSILAAARAYSKGKESPGRTADGQACELRWRSGRKLVKIAEDESSRVSRADQWIRQTWEAMNWPPSGGAPGMSWTGRGARTAVFAGLDARAQARVDACKDRYMEAKLDFDTYFDMPALMSRDFEYLDRFFVTLVEFEDATRTGSVSEQEQLAEQVEKALDLAVEKARELGVDWLEGKPGYAKIMTAKIRISGAKTLANDPASTEHERQQALSTVEDIKENTVEALADLLGGPAELQARLELPAGRIRKAGKTAGINP